MNAYRRGRKKLSAYDIPIRIENFESVQASRNVMRLIFLALLDLDLERRVKSIRNEELRDVVFQIIDRYLAALEH